MPLSFLFSFYFFCFCFFSFISPPLLLLLFFFYFLFLLLFNFPPSFLPFISPPSITVHLLPFNILYYWTISVSLPSPILNFFSTFTPLFLWRVPLTDDKLHTHTRTTVHYNADSPHHENKHTHIYPPTHTNTYRHAHAYEHVYLRNNNFSFRRWYNFIIRKSNKYLFLTIFDHISIIP